MKVKEIIGKIVKAEEGRVYDIAELDVISEYAKDMKAYFNVNAGEGIVVPMILIGKYGIHLFIDLEENANFDEIRRLIDKLVYKYHLDRQSVFWGLLGGLNEALIISTDKETVESKDLISDFENYDRNIRRKEAEKNRLNLKSIKDLILSEEEIKKLNKNIETWVEETYVKEILSDEMIEYYCEKFSEENNKDKRIRTDEDGNEYIKHERKMKITGLSTGEAYYRLSDEDSERTFYITLFGGIVGLHHMLRGDFIKAFLYLISGGGFGILYITDVIAICIGEYFYDETTYENDEQGKLTRKKEKVYLREIEGVKKKISGIAASIIIGIIFTICIIKPAYLKINSTISNASSKAATEYINQSYEQIIEND